MKIRTRSSKAFHNNQNTSSKDKSLSQLVDKITSKIESKIDEQISSQAFSQVIQNCYNCKKYQKKLCQALNLPFLSGPIALNSLPDSFFCQQYLSQQSIQQNVLNQLNYLFQFLKKTKQYYYCWIIYYNEQFKLLNIKLMKKYQLKENIQLLNSKYCLIGIFVDREVHIKSYNAQKQLQIKSTKGNIQKLTAISCYDCSKTVKQKYINFKKQVQLIDQKIDNSESLYSINSYKSAQKTNSSSLKNQFSGKKISSFLKEQDQERQYLKSANIVKNFRRKKVKENLISATSGQKKLKSVSNFFQFQNSGAGVKFVKSLQKRNFKQNENCKEINQNKQKILRSKSNTENKIKGANKQIIDANKLQLNNKYWQGQKNKLMTKKVCKKENTDLKKRRLSKANKVYSSCLSLNIPNSLNNTISSNHTSSSSQFETKNNNIQKINKQINIHSFKKKKVNVVFNVNKTSINKINYK